MRPFPASAPRISLALALALVGAPTLVGCGGGGGGGAQSITAPVITTATAPDATVGAPYQASITLTGGRGTITWSLAAGQSLPPGLALTTALGRAAEISGTPTTAGAFTFTIVVTDETGAAASRAITLAVYGPLAIATASIPDGDVGDPYEATIQAAGGKAPFAWSIASGAFPAGIALSPSAASSVDVRGTATAIGAATVTVRVTDAGGRSAQAAYTLRFDDIERYVYAGKIDNNSTEQVYMTRRVNGAPETPVQLIDNLWTGSFAGMVPIEVSPDGRYVAAIMDRNVNNAMDLFLVDLRGPHTGRIRQVNEGAIGGHNGQWVSRVFWSPDSRWVGFVGDVATAGVQDIFVADVTAPATMTARNITSYTAGQSVSLWDAAFTSDSRHLVFIGDGNPNPLSNPLGWIQELYYADLSSASPTPVRLSIPLSDPANMDVSGFVVAPSGSGVAYKGNLVDPAKQDVFHVALAAGQAGPSVRVSDAGSASDSVWGPWISPDGRRVLFTSGVSPTQIPDPTWNLPSVAGHLAFVTDMQAATPAPATLTALAQGHVQQPVWSPDGKRVLVNRQSYDAALALTGSELLLVDAATHAEARVNGATWDGATIDVAYQQGPWGPMGLDMSAYGFSPDGETAVYKQQTATGFSFFGTTWSVDLFAVDVSGAAPATPVRASPNVIGITSGGIRDGFRFSADSTKIAMSFYNEVAGGIVELYVHDLARGTTAIVGASTQGRLNNNQPVPMAPKWTPGDRAIIVSGPLDATSLAWNELYLLDLAGGRQDLTPAGVTNGDVSNFFAEK